ncbi:hypothetical protein RRG08_042595 [Elysia crispata]|uniref:Uncharacterized protein n=1 Tax=Elysia crispata TaxID=231223 RepID=A0AAE1CKM4_9GAST|nr:hypothetical protein RRG08_042595 [Elysia crispata]
MKVNVVLVVVEVKSKSELSALSALHTDTGKCSSPGADSYLMARPKHTHPLRPSTDSKLIVDRFRGFLQRMDRQGQRGEGAKRSTCGALVHHTWASVMMSVLSPPGRNWTDSAGKLEASWDVKKKTSLE